LLDTFHFQEFQICVHFPILDPDFDHPPARK
jgi:hypothetical protein